MTTAEEVLQRKQVLELELLKAEQDLKKEQSNTELQGDIFEKVLKQIVKTVVEELSADGKKTKIEDYPLVLKVHHVQEILDCGEAKAYEVMRSMRGPIKGSLARSAATVPRDLFWECYLEPFEKGSKGK